MIKLYILFGITMVVYAIIGYLTIGIALIEFKEIYLPFMKKIYNWWQKD